MRIVWHSAPPWTPTGYGVQTALTVPRIQALGHDIAISSTGGMDCSVQTAAGPNGPIPIYPRGVDQYSNDMIPLNLKSFAGDCVITLFDAWVFRPEVMKKPWICYFPVDQEPVGAVEVLRHAAVRVAMSRFGQRETENAGLSCMYAPHCFDPDDYQPRDTTLANLGGKDKYVVGIVAKNAGISHGSPPRKAFHPMFKGFAEFHKRYPDTHLYVHTDSSTAEGGIDLEALAERVGILESAITFPGQYMLRTGQVDPASMSHIYSAMDVLLSPTMGEGFGVPILEAQACGTPVITGSWTAMPEITFTGYPIPKSDATEIDIPAAYPGSQWLVNPKAVTTALVDAYEDWNFDRAEVASKVAHFAADKVIPEYWPQILAQVDALSALPTVKLNRAQRRAKARV